jgi:hypothetical protein
MAGDAYSLAHAETYWPARYAPGSSRFMAATLIEALRQASHYSSQRQRRNRAWAPTGCTASFVRGHHTKPWCHGLLPHDWSCFSFEHQLRAVIVLAPPVQCYLPCIVPAPSAAQQVALDSGEGVKGAPASVVHDHLLLYAACDAPKLLATHAMQLWCGTRSTSTVLHRVLGLLPEKSGSITTCSR